MVCLLGTSFAAEERIRIASVVAIVVDAAVEDAVEPFSTLTVDAVTANVVDPAPAACYALEHVDSERRDASMKYCL